MDFRIIKALSKHFLPMDELHFYKNLSDPAAVPGYHTGPIGCLRLAGPVTVVAYGAWAETNTRCDSLNSCLSHRGGAEQPGNGR